MWGAFYNVKINLEDISDETFNKEVSNMRSQPSALINIKLSLTVISKWFPNTQVKRDYYCVSQLVRALQFVTSATRPAEINSLFELKTFPSFWTQMMNILKTSFSWSVLKITEPRLFHIQSETFSKQVKLG